MDSVLGGVFAVHFLRSSHFSWGTAGIVAPALLFTALLAVVNLRGVGESVTLNVMQTAIEISGLMLVILVGLWASPNRRHSAVFAVVNVAVLVLRRDVRQAGGHFTTTTALPLSGFVASLYLVTPLSGRPLQQYIVAGAWRKNQPTLRRRRIFGEGGDGVRSVGRLGVTM